MKKSLVLAMAMALGVTASAYAANPFSDVPAGHWAYDSVAKLAAAGVVDGYGDATFGGDKLMTRYEMAQIVAKAMAKGANVDKLAAEFADELDTLGVRVANLEKKADNVKIAGNVRYEYGNRKGNLGKARVAVNRLRTRLYVSGQINDDWTYTGRIQNDQKFNNNKGDEGTSLNQASVSGKLGGLAVTAGRTDLTLANGFLYDDTADQVAVSYGKDVKVKAYAGKPTDYGFDKVYGASIATNIGKLALSVGYDKFKDANDNVTNVGDGNNGKDKDGNAKAGYNDIAYVAGADNGIWNVTAAYKMGDVTLHGAYLNSDVEEADMNEYVTGKKANDNDGYVVGLAYKGANRNQIGSWGVWANYYDQGMGTFVAHNAKTGDWAFFNREGFKGYAVGGAVTLAKNMVYNVDYYDLEGKESEKETRVIWNRLQINF